VLFFGKQARAAPRGERPATPMGVYAPAQDREGRPRATASRSAPSAWNGLAMGLTLEAIDDERFAVRLDCAWSAGLANKDGAAVVAARRRYPRFVGRRSLAPGEGALSSRVELADADAMKRSSA